MERCNCCGAHEGNAVRHKLPCGCWFEFAEGRGAMNYCREHRTAALRWEVVDVESGEAWGRFSEASAAKRWALCWWLKEDDFKIIDSEA